MLKTKDKKETLKRSHKIYIYIYSTKDKNYGRNHVQKTMTSGKKKKKKLTRNSISRANNFGKGRQKIFQKNKSRMNFWSVDLYARNLVKGSSSDKRNILNENLDLKLRTKIESAENDKNKHEYKGLFSYF